MYSDGSTMSLNLESCRRTQGILNELGPFPGKQDMCEDPPALQKLPSKRGLKGVEGTGLFVECILVF